MRRLRATLAEAAEEQRPESLNLVEAAVTMSRIRGRKESVESWIITISAIRAGAELEIGKERE